MPRGRLPSLYVPMTVCDSPLITVRSPDISFVTYTRSFGVTAGGAGAAGGARARGRGAPRPFLSPAPPARGAGGADGARTRRREHAGAVTPRHTPPPPRA